MGTYTGSKWGAPGMGQPGGQVTWSFASLGGLMVNFDAVMGAPAFQSAVRAAFQTWENVANIDFVERADSLASDIRLGWDRIDGSGSTLGVTHWQYSGQTTSYGEIGFDLAEAWKVSGISGTVDFLAVAIHEIGHAIGLSHVEDFGSIMNAYLGSQTGLAARDVNAIQVLYGPAVAGQPAIPAPAAPPASIPPVTVTHDSTSETVSVFRFYNEDTGIHFYTASETERDDIIARLHQFRYEGEAFDTPAELDDGIEIFRFYNSDTQAHFYTASETERDAVIDTMAQFRFEGVSFFAHADDEGGEHEAVYRFFNTDTGAHFYTANDVERDFVDDNMQQFRYEGIAYYIDV